MKTRDELAREFSTTDTHPGSWTAVMLETGYLAGFDAGFARAVEMLRSKAVFDAHTFKGSLKRSNEQFADWLEQQQRAEDKK